MALQEEMEQQGVWLFRYRGVLPIVILLIGTILFLYSEFYPSTYTLEYSAYEVPFAMGCLGVSLFGFFIRVYTVGHTPRNTSGRNVKEQVAEKLNTTGIYSVVRHPLYVGNFFMWLGPAIITGNFWFVVAFCLFYWVYYERIMYAEEQFLRRKFGAAYTTWAASVPAFFPDFSSFTPPSLPFSWKKVLKREKNGLAAIFLIFSTFNITGELIDGDTNYNYFLIAMCILIVLLYVILKILQKTTTVLNEAGR